jgi:CheY-like chemotaxis protein
MRLAQVFSNLLNNACKYTEPKGHVWITAQRQGSEVVVRIKDTGIGIPAEQLESIFQMFRQVDQTLERSRGGLGIGLTLVRQLVELHDGAVTAASKGLGHGSEFTVRLPICVGTPEEQTQEPLVPARPMTGRRVFVVDDNPDAAQSLAMLLKMAGNTTETANDGMQAVQRAATYRPEVILLDIGLPRMSGYDVCRAIRAQPWGKDIVIVALTGWGQEEDRRKSKEAGFNGHLVKPADYSALMKLLAELQATS